MEQTKEMLNDILVKIFNQIMFSEEATLQEKSKGKITIRNIHILEAIAGAEQENKTNITSIAKALNITTGTLTVALNKLEKQGYIVRKQSVHDKRVFYITLSKEGKRINKIHTDYHKEMVNFIVKNLSTKEEANLVDLLSKVKYYFTK